jgi:hypothetical protein
MKYLADAIKVSTTIQELYLNITFYPDTMDFLAEALKVNTTIQRLNLSYKNLGS